MERRQHGRRVEEVDGPVEVALHLVLVHARHVDALTQRLAHDRAQRRHVEPRVLVHDERGGRQRAHVPRQLVQPAPSVATSAIELSPPIRKTSRRAEHPAEVVGERELGVGRVVDVDEPVGPRRLHVDVAGPDGGTLPGTAR